MGIFKNETNLSEELKNKLLGEVKRIDAEKEKIRVRIEELKNKIHETPEIDHRINLDDLEKAQLNPSYQEKLQRIQLLERIMKEGYEVDPDYRKAAADYLNAVETEIIRLAKERNDYFEESIQGFEDAKVKAAELNNKGLINDGKIRDLLSPLGGKAIGEYNCRYSLGYIFENFKKSLNKYEKEA